MWILFFLSLSASFSAFALQLSSSSWSSFLLAALRLDHQRLERNQRGFCGEREREEETHNVGLETRGKDLCPSGRSSDEALRGTDRGRETGEGVKEREGIRVDILGPKRGKTTDFCGCCQLFHVQHIHKQLLRSVAARVGQEEEKELVHAVACVF